MNLILGKSVILSRMYQYLMYLSPITLLIYVLLITLIIMYNKRRARLVKLIDKIPGPPGIPILGNTIEINVDHDELFTRILGMRTLWGRRQGFCRAWIGTQPYVFISKPSVVEPILGSPKHIDKSSDYNYLHPWLGTGLLTSSGIKWHSRRKILTPAFHFKILEDFIDVFSEQSSILASKLAVEVEKESFNIFPYVTLCTLDIVCETAMGRQVNAQSNSDSEYVKAVYEIGAIVLNRQAKIWLQPDIIFRRTKHFADHQRCLKVLHDFSYRVIRERKEMIKKEQMKKMQQLANNNNIGDGSCIVERDTSDSEEERMQFITSTSMKVEADEDVVGKKKRLAFLDLLIEASQDGKVLSNDDIREEVDTFMFEGHDTTSAAISWTLFLIGSDPEIQERVIEEIDLVMDGDRERAPTMKELLDMKYLECCIKEALRLYPSVPLIARQIKEDVQIDEYTIPAGTTAMIVTYMLHRNPQIYYKPEQFNPDRFLPENCQGRHPYAYIPFSAGPRNCIGQKFAILEEKSVISAVLRKYKIEAVDRREDLTLMGELILRPKDGLRVRITPRK
ncbi:cytochrome P450 4c3 [Lutzomyia longipalpis]|uniref:cytochrome P450 4c3 n=1 Tax=Lutzomyia longipalpis TaxID=7200 RepID=UPI0024845B54|nr:cytochrome P450 4c3 [Lutzomyia longipalpis]